MEYRQFGQTGDLVSPLGFGAMRLPKEEKEALQVMERALDLGVNYLDTAPYYMDGTSEITVGKAIKGKRDKIYLATKNPIKDASGANWRQRLEKSLRNLQVDYIDYYYMWSINLDVYENRIDVPNGPLEAAWKAKEEGLIRHLCFSVHDIRENVMKIIDQNVFAAVLCQYNLLDREHEKTLAYAKAKGLGTTVMGPVAGGRLAAPSEMITKMLPQGVQSSAEMALRFVFSNENVDVTLSGMGTKEMVEENVATALRSEQLTPEELKRITKIMAEKKKLADLYCTGCEYCLPCPMDINIPEIFSYFNHYNIYGLKDYAKEEYRLLGKKGHWVKGKNAQFCLECGQCEKKCPQKIGISKRLKEVHKILSEEPEKKVEVDWYPR